MRFLIDEVFLQLADHAARKRMSERIKKKHKETVSITVARSILSREIEAICLGEGERYVVVLAAHHSLESVTSNVAYILIDYLLSNLRIGENNRLDCKLLLSKYRFIVIPCVNPDGIELRCHGAGESPLYERQMRMSRGDFSKWQANARGVDLNHNYDAGFFEYKRLEEKMGITAGPSLFSGEYPESEPETHGVANLIRSLSPIAVISLHSQGETIFSFPDTPRVNRVAQKLSNMTGYELGRPDGTAAYGGLCDYTASLGIPSFTFEVGKGENPLSESGVPSIFSRVGDAIAVLPTLL